MKLIDARALRRGLQDAGGLDLVDASLRVPDCDTLAAWPALGAQGAEHASRLLMQRMDRSGLAAAIVTTPIQALISDVLYMVAHAPSRLRAVIPGHPWLDAGILGDLARRGATAIAINGGALAAAGEGAAGTLMRRLAAFGLHLHLTGDDAARALPFALGHGVPVMIDHHLHGAVGAESVPDGSARIADYFGHADLWLCLRVAHEATAGVLARARAHLRPHPPQRMVWGGGAAGPGAVLSALSTLIPDGAALAGVLGGNARWLAFGADLDRDTFGDAA
ncbi:hypothetical protein V5F77_21135 [Xanthobacter sp. DSM 24535]|uniref:hypothetical protein n=1 Tax=Roseixanthobacter psychrophilus TaxID=3119917 RepID=UPI00372AAF9A